MQDMIRKMWHDDDGQDLIEYALIAGLVSLCCWVAITAAGTSIAGVWNSVTGALSNASTSATNGSTT
jgi:Flp pilus assembly pilin Flp